jgi:hypothetical protein
MERTDAAPIRCRRRGQGVDGLLTKQIAELLSFSRKPRLHYPRRSGTPYRKSQLKKRDAMTVAPHNESPSRKKQESKHE